MNKRVITILATTMLFATIAVASVQAQDAGNMSVTIPFDFAVAGKLLPAGDYHVRRSIAGNRSVTEFQNSKASDRLYLPPTHTVQSDTIQSASKLVFNRYGNQYFLSQVSIAGRNVGEELKKTNRERLLQNELARRVARSIKLPAPSCAVNSASISPRNPASPAHSLSSRALRSPGSRWSAE